jgi:hypothetical protein
LSVDAVFCLIGPSESLAPFSLHFLTTGIIVVFEPKAAFFLL